MQFVDDESVDHQIVEALKVEYEVYDIREQNRGVSDDVVLEIALKQKAILITADKDFGELVFRQRKVTGGVILTRLASAEFDRKSAIVLEVIQKYKDRISGNFVVISKNAVRIRSHIT
jgi:predicted nuclease of predicted toxin-antitoxin system